MLSPLLGLTSFYPFCVISFVDWNPIQWRGDLLLSPAPTIDRRILGLVPENLSILLCCNSGAGTPASPPPISSHSAPATPPTISIERSPATTRNGGYADIPNARANRPQNMSEAKWDEAIEYFRSDSHIKISTRNKGNRALQQTKNHGGTASYSSAAFKKGKNRVQVFFDTHTDKDVRFENAKDEENYNALSRELVQETQLVASSSNPTPVNEAVIFEKVLGTRRGHIRGIGVKPSAMPTSGHCNDGHPSHQTQPNTTVDTIVNHPALRETIMNLINSLATQNERNDERNGDGSGDGNGEENEG